MPLKLAYKTNFGKLYQSTVESFFNDSLYNKLRGKINLIFTSPPFPLNRKKKYGNLQGEEYLNWFKSLAPKFKELLAPDGSIIIELGNSWEKNKPTMSILSTKSFISFLENGGFILCQQFIWYNPAKLPGPAQWVTVERIRVKDSFTNLWWMSNTEKPKANNKNVLEEYSESMKKLLKNGKYNSGKRPSEHNIGDITFLKNHNGSIPSNVIIAANTHSQTNYQKYCKENDIIPHPARMPYDLPKFFINFLTEPGDIVFDPFAGSNTTGSVAEELKRNWISLEPEENYINGSKGRFGF
ncbi:MAG: site-specific DNA-methyltransferase [Ignavibacteriae bacterium]|nr:site-specific DNA-methyltransferase [Ignavibacteriota bacterium]